MPFYFLLQIGFVAPSISASGGQFLKLAFSTYSFKVTLKRRIIFCYTFRSLAAPSLSLVSAPMKSRLSSPKKFFILSSDCLLPLNKLMR